MMGLHATIDPQLVASQSGHLSTPTPSASYASLTDGSQQSNPNAMPPGPFPYASSPTRQGEFHQGSSSQQAPPPAPPPSSQSQFPYLRSASTIIARGPQSSPSTSRNSTMPLMPPNGRKQSPLPSEPPPGDRPAPFGADAARALVQLAAAAETLLDICSTLKELCQEQREESKVRMELLRAEAAARTQQQQQQQPQPADDAARGREISIEKVTFATEILKNGPQNEEIKKAAVECLTKYLMRGL